MRDFFAFMLLLCCSLYACANGNSAADSGRSEHQSTLDSLKAEIDQLSLEREKLEEAVARIDGYRDVKLGTRLDAFLETHPSFQVQELSKLPGSDLSPETKHEWDSLEARNQIAMRTAQLPKVLAFFYDSLLTRVEVIYPNPTRALFWTLRDSLEAEHGEWTGVYQPDQLESENDLVYVWEHFLTDRTPRIGQTYTAIRLSRESSPEVSIEYYSGTVRLPGSEIVPPDITGARRFGRAYMELRRGH